MKVEPILKTKILACDQYIFVSNHRSWLDHFVIQKTIKNPSHFIAKEEFHDIPILGAGGRALEYIPAKKNKLSPKNKDRLHSFLKRGDSISIFVEGTRGTQKKLLPFKKGAFRLAAKYNTPVIPIFLYGTENKLSKKNSLLSLKPGNITIIIDQPVIFTRNQLDEQIQAFESNYNTKHNEQYEIYENK